MQDQSDLSRERSLGMFIVRRDQYHGWRLYAQGCPDPHKRFTMMYRSTRQRRWDRRVAAAVGIWIVLGSDRARRYLVRRDWSPGSVKP